ncbi:uncharacterized protein LOC129748368 [Uranotaenia lowii]|uniref:uncharacterized protein LOC129748368 n=1 Tax=Uranotaenia lowii TaxID=190385 RepID=UPI00247A3A13|nr:uncharacterized protein LOC129748368 [Uranotaenia lowii]
MKNLTIIVTILFVQSIIDAKPCESTEESVTSQPVTIRETKDGNDDDKASVEDEIERIFKNIPQEFSNVFLFKPNNIIVAPVVCPGNKKPDKNGKCREVWSRAGFDDDDEENSTFAIIPASSNGVPAPVPQQYHHYSRPMVYQISFFYNYYPEKPSEDRKQMESQKTKENCAESTPSPIPEPENSAVFSLLDAPIVCPQGQAADPKGKCRNIV